MHYISLIAILETSDDLPRQVALCLESTRLSARCRLGVPNLDIVKIAIFASHTEFDF